MRKIYNTQTNYARVQSVWYINTNEDHQRFIYVPFWTFSVWKLIDLLEVGRFTGRPSVQQMVALLDQRNSFREQHLLVKKLMSRLLHSITILLMVF